MPRLFILFGKAQRHPVSCRQDVQAFEVQFKFKPPGRDSFQFSPPLLKGVGRSNLYSDLQRI